MSCRQGSPPEAPNGQKYVPWCLCAFVPEKPFQALWVPFWRQLSRQVREGGREGEKKGFPLPLQQERGCREETGGAGEEGGSDSVLGAGPLGHGRMAVSEEEGDLVPSTQLPRAGRIVGFGGPGTPSPWAPKKGAAFCQISGRRGECPPRSQSCRRESSVLASTRVSPLLPTSFSTSRIPLVPILEFSA